MNAPYRRFGHTPSSNNDDNDGQFVVDDVVTEPNGDGVVIRGDDNDVLCVCVRACLCVHVSVGVRFFDGGSN